MRRYNIVSILAGDMLENFNINSLLKIKQSDLFIRPN